MLIATIIAVVWLTGATASAMVFSAIGERDNPIYGSWTGDYALDNLSIVLWPLSLLIVIGMRIGRGLVRLLVA